MAEYPKSLAIALARYSPWGAQYDRFHDAELEPELRAHPEFVYPGARVQLIPQGRDLLTLLKTRRGIVKLQNFVDQKFIWLLVESWSFGTHSLWAPFDFQPYRECPVIRAHSPLRLTDARLTQLVCPIRPYNLITLPIEESSL